MRLSYYGYAIEDIKQQSCHLHDLRDFLRCFAEYPDVGFKNRFIRDDENFFLVNVGQGFYLYLATRQSEVIKKINNRSLDVVEINELLSANERLGFASYVWLGRSHLAFASTMMAPRAPSFVRFINDILKELNLHQYRLNMFPFLEQTSIGRALAAPFIGRSEIKIQKQHSRFEEIANALGADIEDFVDVDSIEVIIRPRPRANIKRGMSKILRQQDIGTTERLVCRGRLDSLDDALVDLHLAGRGHLSDSISNGSDQDVLQQVIIAIKNNQVLTQKVKDHEQAMQFTEADLSDLHLLGNLDEWSGFVRAV